MSNRVAIVGATGLVGEALLAILQQRSFPISELTRLASERSAGQTIDFNGKEYKVELLDDFDFKSIDFSFFSAGADVSRVFAPKAANAGSVVIDNTSEFRYDDHIPLVIPEVNPHALKDFKENNIIANPNCSTIQMLVALNPIHRAARIKSINVSTYQSISGAGRLMLNEYDRQVVDSNYPDKEENLFAHNVIPQIGSFENNGYSLEEMKMVWDTHKIFQDKSIEVNPTAVRVPVRFGHS